MTVGGQIANFQETLQCVDDELDKGQIALVAVQVTVKSVIQLFLSLQLDKAIR